MSWLLQAVSSELENQEIFIEHDMLVGRHADCDIVLQSSQISRRHAAFYVKDQVLYLEDLKSSNGTFVNDMKIEAQVQLKDGDLVQFASLKFLLVAPTVKEDFVDQKTDHTVDQGMPSLEERDQTIQVDAQGVPQHIQTPKPAPMPAQVETKADAEPNRPLEPQPQAVEDQKNIKVGLITVIMLVILAMLVWFFMK